MSNTNSHFLIHPPCTPASSCTTTRCHPLPPPCKNPAKCLRKTTSKGIRPCQSALSIMGTRSKSQCSSCGKFKHASFCCGTNSRSTPKVEKYLRRKSRETKLKKWDRIKGTHKYLSYTRKKGRKRSKTECCAHVGHRGRLKRQQGCCTIL